MSQTLASDIARNSFDTLRQTVERQCEFSRDEVRELLTGCEMASLGLEKLWEFAQGFIDRGTEARKLTFLLKQLADVIQLGIKTFDAAGERVKAADVRPQERTESLAALQALVERAARMRDELSPLLRRLEAPPRDIDPSLLPERTGEREAKGYIDHDELTAR